MILERLYHDGLAQASWLVGCDVTAQALVVDPNRDIEAYLQAARARQLRITHVTETHIHADFVSGSRALARRAGAALLLSGAGDAEWQYRFAATDGARLLRDGDTVSVGRVRVDVLHTPGHTPEHLSFLVTDATASDRPVGIFTGDFVFVGDVGRPDLLERAANFADTMEPAARTLFRSLERFRALPDWTQVWPGHGAGSACGKSPGALPQSTVGYEKVANWALAALGEDAFARAVLEGQPDPPPYFAVMKRVNRDGPPITDLPELRHLERTAIVPLTDSGAAILDVRPADRFAAGHVPGSVNIPLNRRFTWWAGWFAPYDRDLHLIAESSDEAGRAAHELSLIGLDRIAGGWTAEALDAWTASGRTLGRLEVLSTADLAARSSSLTVLDVRDPHEWAAGHVPGALHIPVAQLPRRATELPRSRPVAVYCETGSRSAIAASLLLARGFSVAGDVRPGFDGWRREGRPVA